MKKVITKKTTASKIKKLRPRKIKEPAEKTSSKNQETSKTIKETANNEYIKVLREVKQQIQEAQVKASFSVNKELLKLYWEIGKTITHQQKMNGWGSKIIEKLSQDVQNEFPGIEGFSHRNISRMLAFFLAYSILPQAVAKLDTCPIFNVPWGHNAVLLEKLKDIQQRLWYAQKAIECGWSRSMLEMWIESKLFDRQGNAVTNFKKIFPEPDSDMAQQALKDPYNFDFLTLSDEAKELDLEQGLIDHIQKFLLELGQGFAFVGRQYHLIVGESDFYIDMLFYHTQLRCYIVIELKTKKLEVKDVGQISFYLSSVDNLLKHPSDNPTIGLLLCKSKDNFVAEYALQAISKPVGVANYTTKLVESLPKELKGKLPTIAEIESGLEKIELMRMKTKPMKKKPVLKKSKKP